MWIELDIEELEFQPSNTIKGFSEALLELLPSLRTHTCSLGYEGGFVERLEEGTWMGHILEHIALELQTLAGIQVKHGKTLTSEKKGIYFVTYDYKEPKSGYYAFKAAMEMVEKLLKGKRGFSVDTYIRNTAHLYYEHKLGPSTEAIYEAALRENIPAERVGTNSMLRLGTGVKQKFVQATITSQTSQLAVENACDKQVTKEILESCGVPVPEGETASSTKEIFEAAKRLGFPLVIKPLNGRQGQGVMTNIYNKDELFNVVNCLDSQYQEYIVERHYTGNDYRLVVVDGKLSAASLRLPPVIVGNGTDSIKKLIQLENEHPLRGEGHEKPLSKIPLNHTVICYLEKENLTLQSIPKRGQVIQVAGNANLSTGGKAIDVTDEVHPTIRNIAITAAKAIGLDVAGIDLICQDISRPADQQQTAVIEVNAAPGIRMHHYPSEGKPRNVGQDIVKYLFKDRAESAIPIVSVTGTNGKTTTTRLVKYFLEQENRTIGMTHSDGVYIGSQCIDEGDCSGPISAKKVLSNPTVDMAVLETARGGILREGLGFRHCDVGIVTNVSEDHLGLDGIETFDQLVKLKRLIPEVVMEGGHCILNADDEEVVRMADYTKGQVIFTSLNGNNPHVRQAVSNGGTAWFMDESGMLHYASGGRQMEFLPARDIPITIEGTAKHNISNVLQALAAAYALGVPAEALKEKALSFVPDFKLLKGRFNKIDVRGRKVIIDYAHNAAGLRAVFETIQSLKSGRVITALSAPGDRLDEDIRQLARISAKHSNVLIIKEDDDLRGRAPYEAANIIRSVALKEKMEAKHAPIVRDELEAFKKAWEMSQEGDLLLFFYTDFNYVQAFFQSI
jgi:cyanophycin synthetase